MSAEKNDDVEETVILGEPTPKQYFPTPEEQAANERAQYEDYDDYDEYDDYDDGWDEPRDRRRGARRGSRKVAPAGRGVSQVGGGSSIWVKIFAALFIVSAALAGVFFLLWRSAAKEASLPQPTVTVTTTRTSVSEVTKTKLPGQGLIEDIFGGSDSSEPSRETGATDEGGSSGVDGSTESSGGTGVGGADTGSSTGSDGDTGGGGLGEIGNELADLGQDLIGRFAG